MAAETIFNNARIVMRDEVLHASLVMRDGRIADLCAGNAGHGHDLDGDLLIPGLVELHTDNLEKHYSPRSGVIWDPVSAAMSHDVQVAGSGITTVFDSIVIGAAEGWDMRDAWLRPMLDGLVEARDGLLLKVDHRLHLRCEVTHPEIAGLLTSFLEEPGLGLISLMDHAPGDRQSPDVAAYKARYSRSFGIDAAAAEAHVRTLIEASQTYGARNRRRLAEIARTHGLAMASHDDASAAHIDEAAGLGCAISEFPTTPEAAQAARRAGLHVLMGAPNLLRGGSHSGNVAAADLARARLLDIISSDYIPSALLPAAVALTAQPFGFSLAQAVATVTADPAEAVGLDDRGVIEIGRRADLVRVRLMGGRPMVRGVWVAGLRVS